MERVCCLVLYRGLGMNLYCSSHSLRAFLHPIYVAHRNFVDDGSTLLSAGLDGQIIRWRTDFDKLLQSRDGTQDEHALDPIALAESMVLERVDTGRKIQAMASMRGAGDRIAVFTGGLVRGPGGGAQAICLTYLDDQPIA